MKAWFARLVALVRNRPVVVICVAGSVLLGSFNVFLWRERQEITRRHEAMRLKGEFMLHALTDRSRINTELSALQDALALIDRNLVDEASMEVNLGYFYKLERQMRVRLARLNQLGSLPPPEGSPFKVVPFSMQVTGSYRSLMGFLRELETGPRLVRIRGYNFSRAVPQSGDMSLELKVELLARL